MRARVLAGCLVLSAAVLGSARPSSACSCAGEAQAAEALRSADVVFEGTVLRGPEAVRAQLGIEGYTGAVRFHFGVARYFKGQRGEEALLYTVDQESACGRAYEANATYVVYGRLQPNGLLTDSLCSRTRLLSAASEDLALLGEGVAPDPAAQPRDVVAQPEEDDAGCSVTSPGGASGSSSSAALLLALALVRRRLARG